MAIFQLFSNLVIYLISHLTTQFAIYLSYQSPYHSVCHLCTLSVILSLTLSSIRCFNYTKK